MDYDAVKGSDGKKLVIPRVSHPHSSSAGASSTRFHEYRRHREFERAYDKMLDADEAQAAMKREFDEKIAADAAESQAKTAKRAAKRARKKAKTRAKRAGPKPPAAAAATAGGSGDGDDDAISITSAEARELLGDTTGADLPPVPAPKRRRGDDTADAGEAGSQQ